MQLRSRPERGDRYQLAESGGGENGRRSPFASTLCGGTASYRGRLYPRGVWAPRGEARPARPKTSRHPTAVFDSIAVVISARKSSVPWYTEKFGPDMIQDDGGHWVTVGRKGRGGVLHLCQISEIDPTIPLEPGDAGISFRLPGEFGTACAALKRRGVELSTLPTKRPWGWYAKIGDPDGNEFRLTPEDA
ncbi:MAG: VOC family protein [Thermoplasmata archaeon]